jgi:hypothetical protein
MRPEFGEFAHALLDAAVPMFLRGAAGDVGGGGLDQEFNAAPQGRVKANGRSPLDCVGSRL